MNYMQEQENEFSRPNVIKLRIYDTNQEGFFQDFKLRKNYKTFLVCVNLMTLPRLLKHK